MSSVLVSIKQLKHAPELTKYLVFGYIRELQSLFWFNIPKIIDYTILFYYYESDKWDKNCVGNYLKLCSNNIIKIIHQTHQSTQMYSSAYLSTICEAPYLYQWQFKINNINPTNRNWNMLIGIYEINIIKLPTKTHHFTADGNNGYAFVGSSSKLTDPDRPGFYQKSPDKVKYGTQLNSGDIVLMQLNMKQLTLKYIINKHDYGIAFNVKNAKYRGAISFSIYRQDDIFNEIQLL